MKRLRNRPTSVFHRARMLAAIAAAGCLALLSIPGNARSAERQMLHGHVPAAASRLVPVGRLDGAKRMNLAIALPLRDQAGLTQLLREIYDPASPRFRQYLTPAQFTAQFGPSGQDYEALIGFAKASGLIVTATHPNRVILDVEGSVTDIERIFHVTLRSYRHPDEARLFHAPDVEPSIDFNGAILSIGGLDDYAIPHPNHRVRPATLAANAVPNSGSGGGGAYAAGDFRAAYVPGTTLTGAGQSVGLLQFDGYYASDINDYRTQFGLPNIPLVNVAVDGGVLTPGSGNGEVCLDIEMVMSMAPGVSTIYVYEAPNSSPWVDLLNRMANDNLAKQLSCSWGGGSPNAAAEVIFQQMAAQGQSFFNATGDSDAFTSAIPFPSESPNITQVGGTTLTTSGAGGSYVSETVWNWGLAQGKYVGSSGGISPTYSIPVWQQGVSMAGNQGSTAKRNVPDVALTGDNVYVKYNNGSSSTFGGTSCAAPLWAGFMALVNQQAVANGQPTLGFVNPALYNIGKGAGYTANFHDTTTGNNFSGNSPAKFAAATGYDLCTGWGTPIGTALIPALAGPFVPGITSFNPGSGVQATAVTITGTSFYSVSNVAFNGVSTSFTVNSATQITASVPASATTGTITVTTPGGTATSATSFTVIPGPPAPSITSFAPAYGLPGSGVTLTGANLTNAGTVKFNGVNASGFIVNSDTQITVTVPAAATSGVLSVTTPSGTAASSQSFTVLTDDGTPTIASFTPALGAPNDSIAIAGTNFVNVTNVKFNGAPALFTVNSPTQIAATVPAGVTTGPITVITGAGTVTSAGSFTATVPPAGSVVISQIYGGGGSSGAPYASDFVELYNRGTQPVSLANCSVQYASASSSNWNGIVVSGTMLPGHYFLVKASSNGSSGTALPAPDATMSINLNATRGKVAFMSNTTAINTSSPVGKPGFVDFVGYGKANAFQGSGSAPAPSNTMADIRLGAGDTNSSDNAADFVTGAPAPHNSSYVPPSPDLTVTSTHGAGFTQADIGDNLTLTVSNVGSAPSSGAVSVADILPAGLTATAFSGAGWTTDLETLTATRSDSIAIGTSYPPLILTVIVASNAPANLSNNVAVSGGGDTNIANNSASDLIPIVSLTAVQSWRLQWFGSAVDSGPGADTAIDAGDGLPNLLKYALNLPPLLPGTIAGVMTLDASSGFLSLSVVKNPHATDVTFTIESTDNLAVPESWSTSAIVVDQNTNFALKAHDITPLANGPRYLHLKVTRP